MAILKDPSQLNFYVLGLQRWATIAEATGTSKKILADLVLTHAFDQAPILCKEMSEHFGNDISQNTEGIDKIVEWLKNKFGLNAHADMVKILNSFLNTCRAKTETLTDFITRFEKNYSEVKKMGEKFSETCLSILLLRQANLNDTDSQIITINLEFDPKGPNAKQHFELTKAAIKKFQHARQANHQAQMSNTSHQPSQPNPLKTFLTTLEQEEQMDLEQIEAIQTFITQTRTRGGGRGRGSQLNRGSRTRQDKVARKWKCEYCLCSHKLWEQCSCPCTTHSRESCPNPNPAKKEAFRKRKAARDENNDGKRQETEQEGITGPRSYLTYSTGFTEKLAEVETEYEQTLLAKVVKETESESFRPLEQLFTALGIQENGATFCPVTHQHAAPPGVQAQPGVAGPQVQESNTDLKKFPGDINRPSPGPESAAQSVFLRTDSGQKWQDTISVSKEIHKLFMLIDCGSPSTLVGVEDFKIIKQQYTEMIQASFTYKQSNKKYEFGGGEKTYSMGKVRLPIYVLDQDKRPHILHVWVEVVNQKNLPLLLGGKSLTNAGGTLCFKTLTLSLDWKNKRLCLPVKQAGSGHFHLQFFPMSEQEDKLLIREMVDRANWTDSEVKNIITYFATETSPDVTVLKAPEKLKNKKLNKALTKQQVIRVHQSLGHAHRDKIKNMVKQTKLYDDNTLKFIDELKNCEVCAVEHNRPPKPKVALPRSSNFNHVVAIDLKENRRYKNAPPYIFYMVDTFTRFKAAIFIKNKQGSTIAEHLVLDWVKYHGAPKYLMSDRGTEFLNGEMKDFCQFHGIRFTTTASYSPHQNAYVERGHQTADRALEKMITADPSLKPQVALAWVIQAVNTLQNVNGFTPFQLVFGRLPRHPTLVEDNPGANQEIADSQSTWARHYRMMMAAREAFISAESDRVLRKALEQRTYTDISKVQLRDWVYFRRNHERYWKGPAKVTLINDKSLHCVFHGQPIILNRDDILLSKPETEEATMEQFVSLPARHQPPVETNLSSPQFVPQTLNTDTGLDPHLVPSLQTNLLPQPNVVDLNTPVSHTYDAQQGVQVQQRGTGVQHQVTTSVSDNYNANSSLFHGNINLSPEEGSQRDQDREAQQYGLTQHGLEADPEQIRPPSDSAPAGQSDSQTAQSGNQAELSSQCQQRECLDPAGLGGQPSPANSTQQPAIDLGTPLQCNLCEKEISSKNFPDHCLSAHGLSRPNIRQHATLAQTKPDSIYENANSLKPGAVVVDDSGNYLSLVKPTPTGWTVQSISTKEERNLDLLRDMVDMRFIGSLESEEEEGINVVDTNKEQTFVEFGAYNKKVFFTAVSNYHEEQVYVVNIPRSKHREPACVTAKQKELRDYDNFEVFEVVDMPDSDNIISTEWVLVEKEKMDGTKVVKARLCIRGDQEKALFNIPRDSPTVNKISVKLLVTLAVSQGWDIRSCDVERAFLQSDPIEREVFVRPPVEMNLPRDKVLQLKKTAYGLVDASRAFFLRQAKELKNIGFHPLSMDPAMFIHKPKGEQMMDGGAAVHVDDTMTAGKKQVLDRAQQKLEENLKYGSVDTLPFRFLGSNYRRLHNGEIMIDQKHYVDALEIPDMPELSKLVKQQVLPEKLQSVFRSLASKLNVLASTVRPDYTYAAKYLTTRYNKATKSDMTQAIKLIKRAKEEPTDIIIPNVGQPEKWILVGVVDASHRTSGNLFAVGGHVVMILNKETMAAAVIHWASKKIERVVHSSSAAETIAMQKMFSTIYLIRRTLTDMCGTRIKSLECVALTDNQGLFSNIHHLKSTSEDYRLHSDIIELRQSIEQEKTVQEVRYVHSSQNLADCLTKVTKSGHMLLQLVRTGQYDLPGGTRVRDTTMTNVRTWNQLMRVEQQDPDLAEKENLPPQC